MVQTDSFNQVEIASSQELGSWLADHHRQTESVWLVTYKKSVPNRYVSTSEVLDELLCFGWIDGIRRKLDEDRTMQLISPRKANHWAQTYKDRATRLIEEGKMQEAGLRCMEWSKQQGLWDFMDDVDQLILPDDLKIVLSEYSGATEFFTSINDASKRFVLRYIKLAKTGKTRMARINEIAFLASKKEKLKGS